MRWTYRTSCSPNKGQYLDMFDSESDLSCASSDEELVEI